MIRKGRGRSRAIRRIHRVPPLLVSMALYGGRWGWAVYCGDLIVVFDSDEQHKEHLLKLFRILSKEEILRAGYGWIVFVCMVVMCLMMALGLAYSIFPDIVIGKLDIWESAASTASLKFALIGTVIAVPMILFYTAFIYKIFYGKSQPLSYE